MGEWNGFFYGLFSQINDRGNCDEKIKLLSFVLSCILIVIVSPISVLAAQHQAYTMVYNEKMDYIDSFSEEQYALDYIIAVINSCDTELITPTALGLSNAYMIEEIFSPAKAGLTENENSKSIYRIRLLDSTKAEAVDIMARLENSSLVESCEVNGKLQLDSVTPNDPSYGFQYAHALCSTDVAWAYTTGSSSVTVAVIDSGMNLTHPDLAPNLWTNPGEIPNDKIDNDQNGYVDDYNGWDFYNNDNNPTDYSGHGSEVAGVLGAVGNNGTGVAGVCWSVKILPLKVTADDGTFKQNGQSTEEAYAAFIDRTIQAVTYASSKGVPIINFSHSWNQKSPAFETVIDTYEGLFVTSAGNEAKNTDGTNRPSALPYANIICVANTTQYDVLHESSNYGVVSVDLAAPGTELKTTLYYSDDETWSTGTSFSAPYVAGAAALIKSLNPLASTSDIKNAILETVDEIPALKGKVLTGGRLNVMEALTYFVTFGDVDLNGAVDMADLLVLRNHITTPYLTGNALIAADIDRNSVVDVGDIMVLQNIIMTTASVEANIE